MTPFNIRDRPGLSDAQVLSCTRLEVLPVICSNLFQHRNSVLPYQLPHLLRGVLVRVRKS